MIRNTVGRALSIVALVATTAAIAACSEKIEAGASCPLLCPQVGAPLLDTVVDAVTMDTSVGTFPLFGFDTLLLLAKYGDTLDTRVVTRYDSLASSFPDSQSVIIDSAFVVGLRRDADSTLGLTDSATVEAYDVTDAVPDTSSAALLAQFTPANLIGSRHFAAGTKVDSLVVALDTARVRLRVATVHRLRISLRMVTSGSEQIRLVGQEGGGGIQLGLRTSADSGSATAFFNPNTADSSIVTSIASTRADFTFVAASRPLPSPTILRVGGWPGHRVLMRFNVPSHIVDSAAVTRATLILTQNPMASAPGAGDTVSVHAVPVIASGLLTDIGVLAEFAGLPANFPASALVVTPKDSAVRSFDVGSMVRAWRLVDTIKTPRLIALELSTEGQTGQAVDFFSIEAPLGVRPRLRLTYVTKVITGRP